MTTRISRLTEIGRSLALFLGAALLLAGCGGEPGQIASGGIGGTGKGTISGYGSIVINDESEYQLTEDTDLRLDGTPTTEAALVALGTGFVANFVLADDADPELLGGTALSVHVEHQLVGPITTAGAGLAVFGQRVVVNGNTVLWNLLDRSALGSLIAGDVLRVSGYANEDNILLATRVEHLSGGAAEWKLTGFVTSLDPGVTLNIDSGSVPNLVTLQAVDITGVTPTDCGAGLVPGDFVDIRADASANDPANPVPLVGVTSVTCRSPGLELPPNIGALTMPASVEGLVESVAASAIVVAGQAAQVDGGTRYFNGEYEDLVVGARVEVRGTLDLVSGILAADKVTFMYPAVRIFAPLPMGDVNPTTQSLTIIGIPVQATPLTKDSSDILLGSEDRRAQVHGYVDSEGQVFALKLQPAGPQMDYENVHLRGPVDDEPIPVQPNFSILGVVIDATGVVLLYAQDGTPLDEQEFFEALTIDSEVNVSSGTYTIGTLSDAGNISIVR